MPTQLLTGVANGVSRGRYCVKMIMTTGDARLSWQVGSEAFADIPDTIKTATTGFEVVLPSCQLKSVITGDAVVSITLIEQFV